MTDYLALAMTYGGFTSLDKVYLEGLLGLMTHEEKLQFLTPPPSVLNAYFAEIYDKRGPEEATAYYFDLSKSLELLSDQPSFVEVYPFVRLNLAGRSYGFAYVDESETALVFAEQAQPVTIDLLFQLAQLFPHYQVFKKSGKVWMQPFSQETKDLTCDEQASTLLTEVYRSEGLVKLRGYNVEELAELAESYPGQRYYHFEERQLALYIIH
ncbi:cystathionine beta-lyase [Streptococcus merionis]|uniref:cystathionine beta-lyase n=1 Tax=Streptococcus merionis TaxID=400065 RepID=UPI0026F09523|nr:cystathionine beta-lyase [Streptococcus merionis]